MPFGCTGLVPRILHDLEEAESLIPGRRVLDLGCGFGFWGAAVRQWFDRGLKPFTTYLMGVEGFGDYRSPAWDLYDYVHVMDIRRWLAWEESQTDQFHLILLLDVLEHFEKDEGRLVLDRLAGRLIPGGRLYVGTPAVWQEQGPVGGNEYQRHRSLWTPADLVARGFSILSDGAAPDQFGHRMLLGVHARPFSLGRS